MNSIKKLIVKFAGVTRSFDVPCDENMTVLDALEKIRHGGIKDLKYRHSCHHGSCGTCGAVIDGTERLMCLSRLEDFPGDEITVEPLSRFTLIGDLAVDPAPLYAAMQIDATYLRESERPKEQPLPPETGARVRFENCIECGLCVNACPVTAEFIGPQSLAQIFRETQNRAEHTASLLKIAERPDGVSGCKRNVACSRVCPTGVMPAKLIQQLKKLTEG